MDELVGQQLIPTSIRHRWLYLLLLVYVIIDEKLGHEVLYGEQFNMFTKPAHLVAARALGTGTRNRGHLQLLGSDPDHLEIHMKNCCRSPIIIIQNLCC
jgi:hypothetical protein